MTFLLKIQPVDDEMTSFAVWLEWLYRETQHDHADNITTVGFRKQPLNPTC